jgi:hypothetical protein
VEEGEWGVGRRAKKGTVWGEEQKKDFEEIEGTHKCPCSLTKCDEALLPMCT